jgi:protein phosphatase
VTAEVHKLPLVDGDVVLLCTDGLTEMLRDAEIAEILLQEPDPQRACEELIARANRAGGRDNVTALIAHFSADGVTESAERPINR